MNLFIKNKKDYAMNLDQKKEDYAMNNINEFVPLKISKNILIYIYIYLLVTKLKVLNYITIINEFFSIKIYLQNHILLCNKWYRI